MGPLTVRGSGTLPGWFVFVVADGTPLPASIGVHDSGFRLESTTVSLTLGLLSQETNTGSNKCEQTPMVTPFFPNEPGL